MTSSRVVKKNHKRSLNKSLKTLSQRNSVDVPVDRLIVMMTSSMMIVGSLNDKMKKCLQTKDKVHAKKKKYKYKKK